MDLLVDGNTASSMQLTPSSRIVTLNYSVSAGQYLKVRFNAIANLTGSIQSSVIIVAD